MLSATPCIVGLLFWLAPLSANAAPADYVLVSNEGDIVEKDDHTTVSFTLINLSESETTKRLAAWGALITIPTLIAGVYGMNFHHMPELDWIWGYPFAIGLMAAVDGYLVYRFKKAGWL